MRRGLFIFMAWICVVGIQAQSDFSFILNKEGKIIVLPKNKTYELNIPKASYKTFTLRGHGISILNCGSHARYSPYVPTRASDGYADIFRRLSAVL